jgi:hypothetical protein
MEITQASFDHSLQENPMGEARKDALRLDFDRGNRKVLELLEHLPLQIQMPMLAFGVFNLMLHILNLSVELLDLLARVLPYSFFAVPYAEHLSIIRSLGVNTFGYNHSRQVFDNQLGCARRQINADGSGHKGLAAIYRDL